MKWFSAGLTFVNFATFFGLLLGMIAGGLDRTTATLAIGLGCAIAVLALLTTRDQELVVASPKKNAAADQRSYKLIWLWLVGGCFALFAVRSFCWVLYNESDQLKIQSPNNLGDLALHITYIRNFSSGVALWPENPIYVFSSVRYPAGVDLFNGLLLLNGVDLRHGLVWVGLLASLATFYAFKRWAGPFGVAAFLFNGGTAGFQLLTTGKWLDYQGDATIAWKSIPLAMFVTQRGLLYAIPAGLLLLYQWRAKYFSVAGGVDPGSNPAPPNDRPQRGRLQPDRLQRRQLQPPLPFWVECSLYATMPLFHLHTFIALSITLGFWFLIGNATVRKQLLVFAGCALLPATFIVWLITDHFQARSVLQWKVGWLQPATSGNEFARSFFSFWFVNFGIALPLALLLLGWGIWTFWKTHPKFPLRIPTNLAFVIPAAIIFILVCLIKFAPWEWDNTKIMIWSYFMILPFLWEDLIARWPVAVRAGICVALFGSGFVSLIGGLSAGGYGFTSRSELDGVAVALRKLPVEARFAAFPVYNHPLLLNGRKVVLGYPGHLWTQGFDYGKVNDQLTALMNGAPNWRQIAHQLKARYLFWGREERSNYSASTRPWEQTMQPVASGSWGAIYDLEPTAGSDGSRRLN
jgi:hypothetical protein